MILASAGSVEAITASISLDCLAVAAARHGIGVLRMPCRTITC